MAYSSKAVSSSTDVIKESLTTSIFSIMVWIDLESIIVVTWTKAKIGFANSLFANCTKEFANASS